ncbi:hypothetical protein [Pararhodobacter oceanensis]|nr:hypothetical protein [Pararhodobacter oceanensis]
MFPQTVLIGLTVAVVGYYLQQRAWQHKLQEETRQREFDECMHLIDSLSKAIDLRLYSITHYAALIRRDDLTDSDITGYTDIVKDWMQEFSSFKSKLFHYYGRDRMLTFEQSVHKQIADASGVVLRAQRYGLQRLSTKHKEEFLGIEARVNIARYTAFKFLQDLNDALSNMEVGKSSHYNNIDVGKLDMISRIYLIQRLLGLKS